MITIINGGTQGLGEAVARKLVGEGRLTGLVLVGRSADRGKALAVMTKNLAYALMRHNIRVNQVNPGWMETESEHHTQMTQDGAPENWVELAAPTRPFERLVQPWEVANAIAFCLSPESGLLTGNVIDIDQTVQGAGEPPLPGSEETPQL